MKKYTLSSLQDEKYLIILYVNTCNYIKIKYILQIRTDSVCYLNVVISSMKHKQTNTQNIKSKYGNLTIVYIIKNLQAK